MTVEITWWDRPRAEIRRLFELAEDSEEQLDSYLDAGRVLVARLDGSVVGHLQLIESAGSIEIKSMAVSDEHQGEGIGRALVEAATVHASTEGIDSILVSTAAADVGNLRFYQRLGFRMLSVERDAFTPKTGYPEPILIDGVTLRDRVWLSRDLP